MNAFILGFQFLSSVHSFGYYIFDFRRQNQYFEVEFQIRNEDLVIRSLFYGDYRGLLTCL